METPMNDLEDIPDYGCRYYDREGRPLRFED